MGNIQRIHCHSAFKHYEMFHCKESSFGNSVFNTTYNFNGGTMCGGGFWGGLWGGLGMGLGAGLMNFLGGGLFGGGFGMFGGGMGLMGGYSPFGLFNRTPVIDGAGGQDNNNSKVTTHKECKNPDGDKYAKLNTRETDLNKNFTVDKLKKLYVDALAGKKECEENENHKDTDLENYNALIDRLKDLAAKNNLEDKDGKLVEKEATAAPKAPAKQEQESKQKVDAKQTAGAASNPTTKKNQAKIALHFAKHDKAGIIDSKIEGIIKGIKTDDEGKLKYYIIDCNDDSDENSFKLRYKVTYKGKDSSGRDIYNVSCISKKQNSAYSHLYKKDDGVDYVYDATRTLINETNDTVVSTQNKNGYTEITYTNDELTENDYEQYELDDSFEINDNVATKEVEVTVEADEAEYEDEDE